MQATADNIGLKTAFIIHKIAYNQKTKIAFVKWKLYEILMSRKYINSPKDPKGAKEDFKRANKLIRRKLCRL
ncbi:MAG: hypothetical protein CV087_02955 [Candidatus Brocadia sp. WS118]|nr:MAG: hypothetical protein CV087_02955 [Candidatus Brocadia sp. WS118]